MVEIQLQHGPSKRTVSMIVSSFQTYAQIVDNIAAVFSISPAEVSLFDNRGAPITSFDDTKDGQLVIVNPVHKTSTNRRSNYRERKGKLKKAVEAADMDLPTYRDKTMDALAGKLAKSAIPMKLQESSSEEDVKPPPRRQAKRALPKSTPPKPSPKSRSLQTNGSMEEMREEFEKLSPAKRGEMTDSESEAYDAWGRKKLVEFLQANWEIQDVNNILQNPEKNIDLRPRMKRSFLHDYERRMLFKQKKSEKEYLEEINSYPKVIWDIGIPLLAHLGLLSEYTKHQGENVLDALQEAVRARQNRYMGRNTGEVLVEDVKKVVEDILEEAEL